VTLRQGRSLATQVCSDCEAGWQALTLQARTLLAQREKIFFGAQVLVVYAFILSTPEEK
jgi:hypothetical protein